MPADKYNKAVIKIIEEQKLIIGPVAIELAKRSQGVTIVSETDITISGDPKLALESLVSQYQKIFGKASVEASKEALKRANMELSPEELPQILK